MQQNMSMVVPSIARVTGCSLFFPKDLSEHLSKKVHLFFLTSEKYCWKISLQYFCAVNLLCLVLLAAGSWQFWPWLSRVSTCLPRVTGPVLRSPSISVICWPQPCCHLRYDFFLLLHHPVRSAVIYRLAKIWTDLLSRFCWYFFPMGLSVNVNIYWN